MGKLIFKYLLILIGLLPFNKLNAQNYYTPQSNTVVTNVTAIINETVYINPIYLANYIEVPLDSSLFAKITMLNINSNRNSERNINKTSPIDSQKEKNPKKKNK